MARVRNLIVKLELTGKKSTERIKHLPYFIRVFNKRILHGKERVKMLLSNSQIKSHKNTKFDMWVGVYQNFSEKLVFI